MTVPMSVQENIRVLVPQGIAGREIARRLGVSRDAVTKYSGQQDYSPRPPSPVAWPAGSVLTGFEETIEQWLGEDQRRPRKQLDTATRVFDRLVAEEGFVGSYSPVQLREKWNVCHRQAGEGFTELIWLAVELVTERMRRVDLLTSCDVAAAVRAAKAAVPREERQEQLDRLVKTVVMHVHRNRARYRRRSLKFPSAH